MEEFTWTNFAWMDAGAGAGKALNPITSLVLLGDSLHDTIGYVSLSGTPLPVSGIPDGGAVTLYFR